MRTTAILGAAVVVGALVLAGCGSDDEGGTTAGGAGGSAAGTSSAGTSPAAAPVLSTADTDLGTIVVDGQGMTVYVFDRDTPGSGESSCSGPCLAAWPPVLAESGTPQVDGVSGEVGTIPRDDGTMQVTLEGWPLYRWQGDSAPGDTTGQGVQGVWWVVDPDGTKVTDTVAPAALPGY